MMVQRMQLSYECLHAVDLILKDIQIDDYCVRLVLKTVQTQNIELNAWDRREFIRHGPVLFIALFEDPWQPNIECWVSGLLGKWLLYRAYFFSDRLQSPVGAWTAVFNAWTWISYIWEIIFFYGRGLLLYKRF